MPSLESSDSDRLLDRIMASIREEAIPEFRDLDAPDLVNSRSQRVSGQNANLLAKQSIHSRRVVMLLAVAAAFVVVLFGVFTFNRPLGGSSVALAEVKAAVLQVQTVRCRFLDFHGDKEPLVTSVASASGIGSRSEGPGGTETITNWKSERMVHINHKKRTVQIMQLFLEPAEISEHDRFTELIRNLPSSSTSELGTEIINGTRVLKYAFEHDGDYVVYVDAATKLPVRMELTLEKGTAGMKKFREVVTDFVFDAPIDQTLFEIKTPEGYHVTKCEEPEGRKRIDTRSIVVSPSTGIAQLPLGATKEQVVAALGQPDQIREEVIGPPTPVPAAPAPATDRVTYHLCYPSHGFDITVASDQGIREVRCYGRREQGNTAREFLGKTDRQLRLGASIEAVLRAYGKPEVRIEGRDQLLLYPHQGWEFRFRDEKLSGFTILKPAPENVIITDNGDGSWETKLSTP